MPGGTVKLSPRSRPVVAGSGTAVQCDQFIEQQLAKTSWRVKLVDIGSVAMGLIGGVIAYVLVIAVLDHWVLEMGWLGRLVALVLLIAGVAYYVARYLVPLVVRRVNPVYAARAIEQSAPSLKNSLINFLMFRRDASPTGRLVYRALRQRAAGDLQQVNVDLAIDRTRLIRIGYAVVVLMVIFAAYTILSPKSVFQTVLRVTAPWASIARPSRVSITDVMPGDNEVFYGQTVTVSATIRGANADDSVRLLYTTEDNQIVDRAIVMQRRESAIHYTCTVPADPAGIQQNGTYRIEAGDARTPDYQIQMNPTPTILVDRVQYDYPTYTRLKPHVSKDGNIHAIEGTRVTIQARTNHPIKSARIRLLPAKASNSLGTRCDGFNGQEARYKLTLKSDDRQTSGPSGYQLTFETKGYRSQASATHKITVTSDLPPEIAILTPKKTNIEVPVNGRQKIEIRAIDPDFGLTRIALRAVAGNENLIDQPLFTESEGRRGQVVVSYVFAPSKLKLVPGDKITLWATAADNRAPRDGVAEPNEARTRDLTITVVPSDPAASRGPNDEGEDSRDAKGPENKDPNQDQSDSKRSKSAADQQNDQSQTDKQSDSASSGNENQSDPKQTENAEQTEQNKQDRQRNQQEEGSESASQGAQGESGQQQADGSESGQQGENSETGQDGSEGQQEEGSQAGDAESQMDSGNQGNSGGSAGQEAGQEAGQTSAGGGSPRGGSTGQQSPSPGTSDGGTDGNATGAESSRDGAQDGGSGTGQQGTRSEPLHDGEVFERVWEQLQSPHGDSQPTSRDPSTQDGSRDSGNPERSQGDGSQSERQGATDDAAGRNGSDGQENSQARENRPGTDPSGSDASGTDPNGADPNQGNASGKDGSPTPKHPRDMSGGQESGSQEPDGRPGKQPGSDADQGSATDPQGAGPEQASDSKAKTSHGGSEKTGKPDANMADDSSNAGAQGNSADREAQEGSAGSENADGSKNSSESKTGDAEASKPGGGSDGQQEEAARPPGSTDHENRDGTQGSQGSNRDGQDGGKSTDQTERAAGDAEGASNKDGSGMPKPSPGETGTEGSDSQPSPGKDGKPGSDQGPSRKDEISSSGHDASKGGAQKGDSRSPPDQTGSESPSTGDPKSGTNVPGGASSRPPESGGVPGQSSDAAREESPEIPPEDEANLEYARKVTDLVLQKLKDQQDEPDPELLKSLGWTQEELRQFIASWESLKRAAREDHGDARRELDDALRSLGLRPSGPRRRATEAARDEVHGLRESSDQSKPPARFLEKFNAYRKGTASGKRGGG